MELLVKLRYEDAKPPIKKRREDAGFDLFTYPYYGGIFPGATIALNCGVSVWIPDGFVGLVFPRSSWRQKGLICQSVFDHGFTGLVEPFVTNSSIKEINIERFERVLQLIIVPAILGGRVRVVDELPQSDRGEKGVGSTGKK